jgi:membrane protein DedA with SNARE-associated domain
MWSKGEAEPSKNRRFQQWFRRYDLLTVFVPAVVPMVPLPLKVFVISAGALQAPFGRFLVVIVVARVIRYGGEAWLGLQLGADAAGFLARNGLALTAAALALAGGLYYLMRMAERRHQKENGSK